MVLEETVLHSTTFGCSSSFPTYKGHWKLSHLAVTTNISSQTNVVLLPPDRNESDITSETTLLCDRKAIRQ